MSNKLSCKPIYVTIDLDVLKTFADLAIFGFFFCYALGKASKK